MTDLVAVAGNAVAAYQRALGTVSNNIANVSTDGYSRQEINLEANPVSKVGNVYLGTGVIVAGVKRQYDAFTEANLRNSNSDLSSQEPMVNYANRVIDVMGGQSTGLTTALDQFFNSARDLSSDPASTVLRGSFVRDAEGLASRFGELSSQLDMVQSETSQALESSVSQMNTIFGELANVNKQLTKVQTEAAQPPDLLDKRDQLLKDLSTYAHVNTKFTVNGTVTVSLGSSINQDIVVDGNNSKLISTFAKADSPGKTSLILDQYGTPSTLTGITSGKVAGLLTFQEQVLGSTRAALDNLATTLTSEINKVHSQGIDGYGKPGGPLFTQDATATSLAGGIKVAFNDPLRVSAAAQFRVIQNPSNTSGSVASLNYVDPAGSDATPGPGPLQSILVNNDHPNAGRTINIDAARPAIAIATVSNGMSDVAIYLDNAQVGQQIQLVTRDGRQILGSSLVGTQGHELSDLENLQASALRSTNGMAQGAELNDSYLNKSGSSAYKDMSVFYGVKADVRQEPIYDSSGQSLASKSLPASVMGGRIKTDQTKIEAGQFTLNGHRLGELTKLDGSTLQANDMADWFNTSIAGFPDAATWGASPAKATNEIHIADNQLNLKASLSINGFMIDSSASKEQLLNHINQAGAGVQAYIGSDGALVIANFNGSNIDIGTTAAGTNTLGTALGNALGISSGTYGGFVSMTRPLAASATQTQLNKNQLTIAVSQLNPKLPLAINGMTIYQPSTGFASPESLAAEINNTLTTVKATVEGTNLILISQNASGQNDIQIAADSSGGNGKTGNALGLPAQIFRSAINSNSMASVDTPDTPIELGFGTGTPADLAKLGFRTGVYIKGTNKEDLLVFVTGTGTASVSASYAGKPVDERQSLRAQPFELTFLAENRYRIRDVNTDTIVAEQSFNPDELHPGVSYQGLQISFTTTPQAGDVFKLDGNADGTGNNENMLAMVQVENKALIGNKTLGTAYIDHVNNVGNIARQATIAQAALKVVHDQAVTAKDQISGVSLDQEAADLIRFQQAYQAAAKVLQVGSQLFDSILQVR
jgi:flagellar hook-associated protein FlgK